MVISDKCRQERVKVRIGIVGEQVGREFFLKKKSLRRKTLSSPQLDLREKVSFPSLLSRAISTCLTQASKE